MAKSASLNHSFKLIWSHVLNAWVAVSEATKGRGKSKAQKVAALLTSALFASASLADPTGGVITSGKGSISQTTGLTTINQTSQNLNINWQTFNVNAGQTVNFVQPSSTALAVNRIFDTNGSRIMGNINANGRVWLINPNGVFFGQGSQVNVGSLLASTLNPLSNINDTTQVFGNGGTGSIINQGTINASNGYVAFIGNTVSNVGNIHANGGTVALGAGSKVSLKFADNQLLGLTINKSTLDNLAENKGLIQANGGAVFLSAGAKDSLLASVVNNEGIIEAKTVNHKSGKIILLGGLAAGTTTVSGTLDASAVEGDGGFIETSGAKVKLIESSLNINAGSITGKAGKWVIDPKDFTIAASGGDVTGAFLSQQLQNQSVQIYSTQGAGDGNGDIHVNDTITWTSGLSLELNADRNINVNKAINGTILALTAVGSVNVNDVVSISEILDINYGANANYSPNTNVRPSDTAALNMKMDSNGFVGKINLGANASEVRINGSNYTIIRDRAGLEAIQAGAAAATFSPFKYVLGNDIDLQNIAWTPTQTFHGSFDGLGHKVTGLNVNSTLQNVGFFGSILRQTASTQGGYVANFGVEGSVTGSNTGNSSVGGLAGTVTAAFVRNAYSKVNVTGGGTPTQNHLIGGLVGSVGGNSRIQNAFSSGTVTIAPTVTTINSNAGGLLGLLNCASTGPCIIDRVFSTGNVDAGVGVGGGLIGRTINVTPTTSITNVYATGDVAGNNGAGGLIGQLSSAANGPTINGAFASGTVSGPKAGTLIGRLSLATPSNTITNVYVKSGNLIGESITGTAALDPAGITVADFGNPAQTFANLDMNVWSVANGTPMLKVFATTQNTISLTYTLNALVDSYTYNGMGFDLANLWSATTIFGADYSTWLAGTDYTFSFGGNTVTSFTNAGTYSNITVNVLKDGFSTATTGNTAGTLTIDKKAVTVSGITADNKTYDGTNNAVVNTTNAVYTGLVMGENLTTTATGQFADKNASNTAINVNLTGTTSAGANTLLSNYAVTEQTTTTANIGKKGVTVSGITADNKTYDGTNSAVVNTANAVYTGLVMGENLTTTATGEFADKNASDNAKTVTLTGNTTAGANTLLSNYTVTEQTTTTANIGKKGVTVSGITADNKTYDGTKDAVVSTTNTVYTGLVMGENLTTTATGEFADKNASDTAKTVNLTSTTSAGANTLLSNYTVTEQATTTANIAKKAVTVSGITADNKTYDGTNSAVVNSTNAVYTGLVMGENLTTTATGQFADKNASNTAITVNLTGTTSAGANTLLSNYSVTEQATTTASIGKKGVTVSGITADNKTYDGTNNAVVNSTNAVYTGLVMGENLSTTATGQFTDKNASDTAKTVNLTGTTSAGANTNLSNYTVTEQTSTTATISKKDITVTANTVTKTYDGTTSATGTATVGTLATNDAVNNAGSQAFTDKNAGVGTKVVEASGVTIKDNTNADMTANYNISYVDNTSSTINQAELVYVAAPVTVSQGQKPVLTGTVTGFVNGETLAGVFSNSPTWTTTGNTNVAGTYAVNGEGLSALDANTAAANYFITQASSNATALKVNPLVITPPVTTPQVGNGAVDSNNVINAAKSGLPRLFPSAAQLQVLNANNVAESTEEVGFVDTNFANLSDIVQNSRLGILTIINDGVNTGL